MWSDKKGAETDVVLMTKTLIVRNIKGFQFCSKMSSADKDSVLGMVRQASNKMNLKFLRADELNKDVLLDLYDNQLINARIIVNPNSKGILLDEDKGLSVIVNDEEHIAIQAVANGSQIENTYKAADEVARMFEQEMDIAYSDKYGFLTADTNKVGTGVHIFSLVSIPGIEKTADAITVLARRLGKYDWKLVPFTTPRGEKVPGFYILVNLVTLGITETNLIERAKNVIDDVAKLERTCRKNIYSRKKAIVEDQYYRSYGALRYARQLELQETFNYLCWLRMGHELIKDTDDVELSWEKINSMSKKITRNKMDVEKNGPVSLKAKTDLANTIRTIMKGDE